jgi:light-regulated signal transduction histidine kinase (bacteriophytochrome)
LTMSDTDRIYVEDEVRKQLDRANEDFEDFISRAAHDLRESLREIASYSELVSETYASRLGSDAGVYMAHIQQGAAKAQSLLADVVDYSAVGGRGRQTSPTDMEAALVQALLCADRQITERNAVVTHDSLPRVIGDFELLTKVLHHLICNAIGYSLADPPRVHLSTRREGLDWAFSVRDNGPGIDPAFQAQIFEVFRRLHGKEYPGNGLGLAFCKKAIEWHGGRMWVESMPGAGSTFYFSLPAAE